MRPPRIGLELNPLDLGRQGEDDDADITGGVHVESPMYEPSPAQLSPDADAPAPAETSRGVTLSRTPNLWRSFPPNLDWGQRTLPDYIECVPIEGRAYWLVEDFEPEARARDWNLVDFGSHGSPGWVAGIGPVLLKAAYPREMGYHQKPWWYVVQKILPFPSQLQADAPNLLVPAQLVEATDEEVVMWGVRGVDDELDDMAVTEAAAGGLWHGVIRTEYSGAQYPIIHQHAGVDDGALKRLAHAWRHLCPDLADSVIGGEQDASNHTELPEAPYTELDQLMRLDRVPSGLIAPPIEFTEDPSGTEVEIRESRGLFRRCAIA